MPQDVTNDALTFHGMPAGNVKNFFAMSADEQNDRRTLLTLALADRTVSLWLDEVAARHLWISYARGVNNTFSSHVKLDDDIMLSASAFLAPQDETLALTVKHPGLGSRSENYPLVRGSYNVYVIALGMGGDAPQGMRDWATDELARLHGRRPRLPQSDRGLISRSLQIAGQQWLAQTALATEVYNRVTGEHRRYFYNIGVAGQESAPYVDMKNCVVFSPSYSTKFDGRMLFASALEHAVLDQFNNGVAAVSTVKILELANAATAARVNPVYFATSANYNTQIRPKLLNYSANKLAEFANLVAQGKTLLLPQKGNVTLKDWEGYGYISHGPEGDGHATGMIIAGGLNGGFSSTKVEQNSGDNLFNWVSTKRVGQAVADPVIMPAGAFVEDVADMTIPGPLPMTWSRHYDSRRVHLDIGMGKGWTHGYDVNLVEHADPDVVFGRSFVEAALPTAVAMAVVNDLLDDSYNVMNAGEKSRRWVLAALTVQWWVKYLNNATASVSIQNQTLSFQRRPDLTYAPYPGVTAELIREYFVPPGSPTVAYKNFQLVARLGPTYEFNSQLRLHTITSRSGGKIALRYGTITDRPLVEVKNELGQSFSLSWVNSLITTVTDHSGRAVHYGYGGSWLIKAVDRGTRKTLAWVLGRRDSATFRKLYNKVKHLKKCIFYTDNWSGFSDVLPPRRHRTGKAHTLAIERDNSNTRHHLGRFTRRTKVVSKSNVMVDRSIRLWRALQTPAVFNAFQKTALSIYK